MAKCIDLIYNSKLKHVVYSTLKLKLTPFYQSVWLFLHSVPFNQLSAYKQSNLIPETGIILHVPH